MPVPVFDHPINDKDEIVPKIKEKTSGAAVFFAVFLVIVSLFTTELFLIDINKNFNSEYDICHVTGESNKIFDSLAKTTDCDLQKYEGIRLLIHIDVMIPFVITGFIFLFIIRKKKLTSYYKVLRNAFVVFIAWLSVRMVGELEYYLIKHEPIIGKYVVLLTIIILLIYLVILIQKKFIKKPV